MQQIGKQYTLLFIFLGLLLTACDIDSYDYSQSEDEVFDLDEELEEETAVSNPQTSENETEVADFDSTANFETSDCSFEIPNRYDVECGYLTVPENRTQPQSPDIQLAVAILYAPDYQAGAENAPVIYLAGGPGGSAIDDFAADPAGWGEYPFLRTRDLILLDQRGTGHSQPTLDCPEFQTVSEQADPDALCYDRLIASGIDLAAYNTHENSADVAALREALGIDEWNLLGISYGTRLALDVMKNHPEGIRSVILDSPFPPNADTPVDEIYSVTDALTELFADCDRDSYCREEYPDLENLFLETVQRLNEDPTAEIYGDDLVFALSTAFSDTSLVPLLPYVIYEVANDNIDSLEEISTEYDGASRYKYQDADFSDSEGMYNSVICYDEYALGDYDRVEEAIIGTIPVELEGALLQTTLSLTQLCAYWSPRNAVDNTAVSSDIPTLILSGQYDVATPPRWASLTAGTLSNAYLFEFPGAGHSLLSDVECAINITSNFLEQPDQSPNGACINEIEWPFFE